MIYSALFMPPFCEGGAVLASNFEIVVDFDLICPIYIIKYQKVNKHPKFDDNFDIRHKLDHFEYEKDFWRLGVCRKFILI